MGEKKDGVIGLVFIVIIIVIIIGIVVWAMGPGETKMENDAGETAESDLNEDTNENSELTSEEMQEIEKASEKIAIAIPEYQKTNEILKSYSTVGIIEDILDEKTTALDDRIEYHSMTEPRDGLNKEDLLYIVGEIEYEVTACEQNTHPTGIAGLMESLRYDLEDKIKSGYGKDSSMIPLLQRAKVAINAYSDCIDKSGNQ